MSNNNTPINNLIILIGMMGSGKSKCGKILAKKLNFNFFDIDDLIEKHENSKINTIFNLHGEKYFRSIEKEIIFNKVRDCLKKRNKSVISLGGGAFENNETRKFLLKNSTIVWLYANIETLISRVGDANNRPMLKGDVKSTFETLVNKRNKNYQKSHLKIMTDNRSFQEICDIITESFQ